MSTEPIVNRVAQSALKSIDLADYLDKGPQLAIDLAENLFQGLILKEKDFRDFVRQHDWDQYADANVRIHCSADAIIPIWAYMLVSSKLSQANLVVEGSAEELERALIRQAVARMSKEDLTDAKVVIKGCGAVSNKEYAYTEITKALVPKVTSLMYGEPCSTVPVYKRPRK